MCLLFGRRVDADDNPFPEASWLRSGARSPPRTHREVLRLRPRKELRIPFVLRDEPVHERVAVLRRPELRDVHEFWPRLLADRMHAANAQDVECIDDIASQTVVYLADHLFLAVRMGAV